MSDDPDWISKRDAATLADVDERTIERKARAGKIDSRGRPGFPTRYWRADVEKVAQTAAQEVRTGLVEAVRPGPANGNGAVVHQRARTASFEELLTEVLQAARVALAHGATGPTPAPTGPTRPRVEDLPSFVPLDLAIAYSGLSERYLRKMIKRGTLTVIRDARQWKIHKPDLVKLG